MERFAIDVASWKWKWKWKWKWMSLLVIITSATSYSQDTTYQFVKDGVKLNVVETGGTWNQESDHIWISGTNKYLRASQQVAGNFTIKVVLNLNEINGTAASFQIGSYNFGFEGSSKEIFTEGGDWPNETWGAASDYITPDENFTFEVSRIGNEISFKINGKTICTKRIGMEPLTASIRPWRNAIRVYQFYAQSDIIQLPQRKTVFQAGESGYACFRIPAIIRSPNGNLLAFAEGRVHDCGDHGNIDLVLKISQDNGATWGSLKRIRDYGTGVAGNPGPVVDEVTGQIILAYNTSLTAESEIKKGNGAREVWFMTSDDNGVTWEKSRNITLDVNKPHEPNLNPEYTFSEDWRWNAVLPGHAIMLKKEPYAGRLLITANHTTPENNLASLVSHVFWSDDNGETWVLGGNAPTHTNEAISVELANGDILMNMRHYKGGGKRAFSISKDGGETFGSLFFPEDLISPVVQGSIIRYTTTKDSDKNRLLISNPNDKSSRINMTIRMSYDEGMTWPYSYLVEGGFGAYSDLVIQEDQRIGILYEGGNKYGSLYYKSYSLKDISGGNDILGTPHSETDSISDPGTSLIHEASPSSNLIHVNDHQIVIESVSSSQVRFEILNSEGDLIQSYQWQGETEQTIPLSRLKSGTYLYLLKSKDHSKTGSLLVR